MGSDTITAKLRPPRALICTEQKWESISPSLTALERITNIKDHILEVG